MIQNKKELKEYLAYEKALYFGGGNGSYLRAWLLRSKFTGFGSICGRSGMRNIIKTEFPAERIPGR